MGLFHNYDKDIEEIKKELSKNKDRVAVLEAQVKDLLQANNSSLKQFEKKPTVDSSRFPKSIDVAIYGEDSVLKEVKTFSSCREASTYLGRSSHFCADEVRSLKSHHEWNGYLNVIKQGGKYYKFDVGSKTKISGRRGKSLVVHIHDNTGSIVETKKFDKFQGASKYFNKYPSWAYDKMFRQQRRGISDGSSLELTQDLRTYSKEKIIRNKQNKDNKFKITE